MVKQDIKLLKEYLEKPLDPDWKIPLSHFEWKELLVGEEFPDHACCDQDLELLFKQREDKTAGPIRNLLKLAITNGPLDPDSTEESLYRFWDDNIRRILVRCLNANGIRHGGEGEEPGQFRPDFGLLLADVCVFRGEENSRIFTGKHPKDELKDKTRWVYGSAPCIFGW